MGASRGQADGVTKIPTGIGGFDAISEGGLPRGGLTLVSGTPGSGKTVFATQFLAEGIHKFGETVVFVTFEERPRRIARHMAGFGWPIEQWEKEKKWAFVDASPFVEGVEVQGGTFTLDGLVARIKHAAKEIGATRVAMDSLGTMFNQVVDPTIMRNELYRITMALQEIGCTTVLTAEREHDHDSIGRYGFEEFVADNVIILRNTLECEKRRRTVEILKFRGTTHRKGGFPFIVLESKGIEVISLAGKRLDQRTSETRATSGDARLDQMCGGGFLQNSIILLSGATGTGKTLTSTTFLGAGLKTGERCLLFAFEESHDQLLRNAKAWGIDLTALEQKGQLKIVNIYPETLGLDELLVRVEEIIRDFNPKRVAFDSLSALERTATERTFREFVIATTALVKELEIMALYTATTPTLLGGSSATEAHISTITDTIILLRYVEILGSMHRGIMVLKMRGSFHEKEIREFTITERGLKIGHPFQNVAGILSGQTTVLTGENELGRMESMFSGGE